MKKRIIVSAVFILALLFIAGGMWYTRPMTFAQLLPELDQSKTDGLTAFYTIPEGNTDSRETSFDTVNLNGDDPAIQWLLMLLDAQTYHRSPTSLLLHFRAVYSSKAPGWSVVVYGKYSLELTAGKNKLYVHYTDDEKTRFYYCTVENQGQFVQAVTELLMAHTPQE